MKTLIFPKNKEYFRKLIPFAQKILRICSENGISPVIYGSFAHFYYTQDRSLKVNDLDLMIQRKSLKKLIEILEKKKIKFTRCSPQDYSIVLKNGELILELDEGGGYKTITDRTMSNDIFNKIDFYGISCRMVTLKQVEEIYSIGYNVSRDNKQKIAEKVKHLEKFLGKKIKNDISVEIVKNKDLTSTQKSNINNARVSNWGEGERKDFSRDYEPETLWFFVKNKSKLVSLGGIRPVRAKYLGKTYNIGGICSTISLEKGKGFGKIMVSFLANYSIRTGKSILGFTARENIPFFRKAHLKAEKNFIKRFIYVNPKTGKKTYDDCGDGIYYNGEDNFIKKVLSTKSPVYINVLHW